MSKKDRTMLLECIRRASEDGTSYVVQSTIPHRDGSVRRLRCNGGAVRDESGAIVRLAGIAEDITESWLLEQRLRRSEERYELALEGTSDGIFQFDWRTRQIEVSPRLLDLVGRPHDNRWVTVDWVSTVVVESDLPLLRTALDLHVRERVPLDLELRLITLDRGIRWFRVRGRAVRDEHGAALRLAGAVSDVTEQRAMHARLQHTSKMTALGTLAGGIAHDFNNLVAAMLGYAELAVDEIPRGSVASAHVQQVIEAAERARDLVREILAYSRPEDRRRSAVDLSQLAVATERLVRSTIPPSVQLHVEGNEQAHLVLGDPIQLQRVLLNLCTNSIDAVRRRHATDLVTSANASANASAAKGPSTHAASIGTVTVRLGEEASAETIQNQGLPPGRYVRIQVSDDGVGISPDVLARVFEPFFTTKPVGEGTGLGLSVVHSIVVANGGSVHVESVERVGTTVTVWLPLLEGSHIVAPVDAPAAAVVEAGTRSRVVVIDDDPAVGRLLQVALQRSHYRVTLFTSPTAALDALRAHPDSCDCIVTDFAMPELNGIDLLSRLRADGVQAPAILVTGFADGASYEARERVGIVTTLQKPIELRRFIQAVDSALATAATQRPVVIPQLE
ncbi:MAG: response regulator [Gemmatimonadaceae bacterium]|nr:response regulator [Gemmatimonadaceae bacterium]